MDRVVYTDEVEQIDRFAALVRKSAPQALALAGSDVATFRLACAPGNPFFTYGNIENIGIAIRGDFVAHASLTFDSRLPEVAHLGYVYLLEDSNAEDELFVAISEYATVRGVHVVRGPINGNTWQDFRYVTGGSKVAPFFLEPHCTLDKEVWMRQGFVPKVQYESVKGAVSDAHFTAPARSRCTVERLTRDTATTAVRDLHAVALDAFRNTWSFIPISLAEFAYIYEQPLSMLDTLYISVAKNSEGEIVGFFVGAPDVYDTSGKTFVCKTVAVRSAYANQGVGNALFHYMHAHARAQGYTQYIYSTMQTGNEPIHGVIGGGDVFRTYTVGEKII